VKYPLAVSGAAVALLASFLAAPAGLRVAAAAATPPPTPPPPHSSTAPMPTLPPGTGSLAPGATPTPPPGDENRKGIEGVWEVQIQHTDSTEYVHWKLVQDTSAASSATLSGVYLDKDGKAFPLAGALDGKTIDIVVSLKNGTSIVFKATLEGTSDMLGMMTMGPDSIAFTAAYRPKYKFIDNISPSTGGITGNGGGGMYSPKPRT
jgi:hypothetical protein